MKPFNLERLDIESEISTPEKTWEFSALGLANQTGISTKLNRDVWLDWTDVLSKPETARMHMYPGASKEVGLSIKRTRMETWQAAIAVFDSMMIDVKAPLEPEAVKSMLERQKLPRPRQVVLPTDNPSIMRLFHSLGIFQTPKEEIARIAQWAELVELARANALLAPRAYLRDLDKKKITH